MVRPIPETHFVGAFRGREEFCGQAAQPRRIGAEVFSRDGLPSQDKAGIGGDKLSLEAEVDARGEAQVGAAVGYREEGTGPEAHSLGFHLFQDVFQRRFGAGIHIGRQGVYAHGEGGAGICAFAAVPDGGEAGGGIGVPGGQRQAEEGREKDAVGIAVALQHFAHGGGGERQVHGELLVGLFRGVVNVRDYAAFGVGGRAELGGKPRLGLLEGLAFAQLLFLKGKLSAAYLLGRNFPAVVGGTQVVQDNGDAGPVGNDVVKVHVKVCVRGRFIDFQAEKPVLK